MTQPQPRPVLVTGAAGFIGFHVAHRLLRLGIEVIGYDNVNSYYDPRLKRQRIAELKAAQQSPGQLHFYENDITSEENLRRIFDRYQPSIVIHLAAQAGVRHSIESPGSYMDANLIGLQRLLEVSSHGKVDHFLFASSSSVYGARASYSRPFSESDPVDTPTSLYAATKVSGEAITHSYAHLYKMPTTAMRFFTVYGPSGRPDLALFKFAEALVRGEEITVYGAGGSQRDYTYIDDIVESILRLMHLPPEGEKSAPWRALNIGGGRPHTVLDLVQTLAEAYGLPPRILHMDEQPGDMAHTLADTRKLQALTDFTPSTELAEGVSRFVDWHREWSGHLDR